MKTENSSSAFSSDTTSSSAPSSSEQAKAPSLSEGDFLQQQAAAAKQAIAGAFAELKNDLAKGADPRVWVKAHPWISLASVTLVGFASAAAVIPSKEQQALRKLYAIERALHPGRESAKSSNGNGDGKKPDGGGIVGALLHELFALIRPIIMTLISANLTGGNQPEPSTQAGQSSDGQTNPASASA